MRPVILESPYRGREDNVVYARDCLRDSLKRGEAPLASHLLYTQVLDDSHELERSQGIRAGLAWAQYAEATVVYCDRGISDGMCQGVQDAHVAERRVELRSLSVMIAEVRQRCPECYLIYYGALAVGCLPCPLCEPWPPGGPVP